MKFQAIIPAAGVGKRLRPLTHTLPKSLVPVAGKPIIVHIIDELVSIGIEDIVLILGYFGEKIEEYLKQHYPQIKFTFVYQRERKGSAHAVLLTESAIKHPVMIIYGDTIIEGDLRNGIKKGKDLLLGTKFVDDPRRFGIVERENGKIVGLVEKPNILERREALVGVYTVFNTKKLFESIKYIIKNNITLNGEFYLTHALDHMIKSGASAETFPIENWYDCGTVESLLETNKILLDKKRRFKENVIVDDNIIIPPVAIGKNTKLKNCIIGPYVSIGSDANLEGAIIQNSIISDKAKVKNLILKDSVIGNEAECEGKTTNLILGDNSYLGY
ncbi:MAG: glucose-phosphate thymidylyltransferase [Candidatus Woesearchaeota archaeon]|nr:glucose-phosphate thymidylyltransferase [Candidatus Woesearchaeota archaeon]MDN5327506.1 glucose-phosphate thymidylyltransferase [Candidatus Woesearchaeota archaeon]